MSEGRRSPRSKLVSNTSDVSSFGRPFSSQVGSDYMFKVSNSAIIDATFKGSLARYINASCSPNCVTKIITAGSARVVIYAFADIEVGEELVYDYKFPIAQGDEEILRCYCGAENCRGWMNWVES